jgi:hypothetical protein
MNAISAVDLSGVRSALEREANVNFCLSRDEDEPDGSIQPTTPLRLVVFRISDCCLSNEELVRFAEIARVLLAAGTDPLPWSSPRVVTARTILRRKRIRFNKCARSWWKPRSQPLNSRRNKRNKPSTSQPGTS